MVELQIISKILNTKNIGFLKVNNIDESYFPTYKKEFKYISDHYNKYGNIPDKETFLNKFNNFQIVDVTEKDKYLVDELIEENTYLKLVPVLKKVIDLSKYDSREAIEYWISASNGLLDRSSTTGIDIISSASLRFEEYLKRKDSKADYLIPTGFDELDDVIGGWQSGEEFIVFVARTGNGKTWVLIKSLEAAWKSGKRVGLIEPEMTASKLGYRFDTINSNFSNKAMLRGEELHDYDTYISELGNAETPFFVATPQDFNNKITVSKLRNFIISNKLDILGIDGISYLDDERKERGDNLTTQLSHISRDLMDLSVELQIPILVVVQSNRDGAKGDDAPGVENIRDSDGIAYSASLVIGVKKRGNGSLELAIQKNRNAEDGQSLVYTWYPDKGYFKYIPTHERDGEEVVNKLYDEYGDGDEEF